MIIKKSLAIIPARGGSKRIPKKNIKPFCGKPILSYSIEAALTSNLFEEIMVSTDSREIADVALAYGAKVPFLRSEKASGDFATTADVLLEVLEQYHCQGIDFETICCLYPTAPFVTHNELVDAYGLLNESQAPSVISVTDFDFPPQRAFKLLKDGAIVYSEPEYAMTRSQDLPRLVHDCGQFCFTRVNRFFETRMLVMDGTLPFYVSPISAQDIDSETDWLIAEMKFRLRNKENI